MIYPLPLSSLNPSSTWLCWGLGQKSSRSKLKGKSKWLCGELRGLSGLHPCCLPWWCDGSEVFPHGLDHSSPPDPKTCTYSNSSIKEQPDRSNSFLQDSTLFINQPQSYKGANGITGRERKDHILYVQLLFYYGFQFYNDVTVTGIQ